MNHGGFEMGMLIEKIRKAWKEHGTLGLLQRIVRHKCPVHFCIIYCKDDSNVNCSIDGLSIMKFGTLDLVDPSTLKAIEGASGAHPVPFMNRMFAIGCQLWVGRLEGIVVGMCWSRSHQKRNDYFVPLNETDATILSCIVFSSFRGRGIYPSMLEHMVNSLRNDEDIKRVYIDCKSWNSPSIRGIQKAGFRVVGTAVRLALRDRMWIISNRCQSESRTALPKGIKVD